MSIQRFEITDSRNVGWTVVVSGPYRTGSIGVEDSLESLPQTWIARFSTAAFDEDIRIELDTSSVTPGRLRELLEKDPL